MAEQDDIRSIPFDRTGIYLMITGPEGGFDDTEIEVSRARGISIVHLHGAILRAETAPLVALTACSLYAGRM